jgi:predicted permease
MGCFAQGLLLSVVVVHLHFVPALVFNLLHESPHQSVIFIYMIIFGVGCISFLGLDTYQMPTGKSF